MKFLRLVAAVIICELAGIIGSVFTVQNIPGWYAYLNKPSFNPPNYLFGPVWTTLYLLMGISVFLVWENKNKTGKAVIIFFAQLVLNACWTLIFFGLKSPGWAFVEIAALWIMIVWCIVEFRSISKPAAYLLIPYLLWVSYASVLTFSIWKLN